MATVVMPPTERLSLGYCLLLASAHSDCTGKASAEEGEGDRFGNFADLISAKIVSSGGAVKAQSYATAAKRLRRRRPSRRRLLLVCVGPCAHLLPPRRSLC
jgi:hypothetical protein